MSPRLLPLSLLIALAIPASADAGGPWFVAKTGNNANTCLDAAHACLSISAAVTKASAGDTINIGAGTYSEGISTNKAPVFVGAGEGPGGTVVNASGVASSAFDLTQGGTLRHMHVISQSGATINAGAASGVRTTTLDSVIVDATGLQSPIDASTSAGAFMTVQITDSTLHAMAPGPGGSPDGVELDDAITGIVTRSTITSTTSDGIDTSGGASLTLTDSTVAGAWGISVVNGPLSVVRSTITGNAGPAIGHGGYSGPACAERPDRRFARHRDRGRPAGQQRAQHPRLDRDRAQQHVRHVDGERRCRRRARDDHEHRRGERDARRLDRPRRCAGRDPQRRRDRWRRGVAVELVLGVPERPHAQRRPRPGGGRDRRRSDAQRELHARRRVALIDHGDQAGLEPGEQALNGNRVLDGDGDGTAIVDVGAYEHATVQPPAPPDSGPPPVAKDTTAPVLTKVSLKRRRLRFTLSEAATVRVKIKRLGAKKARLVKLIGKAGKNSARLPKFHAGRYTITLRATDAAGNASKTLTKHLKR